MKIWSPLLGLSIFLFCGLAVIGRDFDGEDESLAEDRLWVWMSILGPWSCNSWWRERRSESRRGSVSRRLILYGS